MEKATDKVGGFGTRSREGRWPSRIITLVALGAIGWLWFDKAAKLRALETEYARRDAAVMENFERTSAAQEEKRFSNLARLHTQFQARLQDPAFLDGSKARQAHEEEWRRRQAHDRMLARSPAERSLLEMEKLGADAQLSAQGALTRVAQLASPPGSRIEVTPVGGAFEVRVAYRMSALSRGESGAATKHTSKAAMRSEIRLLSARVARALFTYCGSRGISRIALTCNHTTMNWLIPPGATAQEQALLRQQGTKSQSKLYRVVLEGADAKNISNWSRATDDEVLQLLRVEFDGIEGIQISSDISGDLSDASGPLLF